MPAQADDTRPLGQTQFWILATLNDGPGHGYSIHQRIADLTEGSTTVALGNLYVALRQLESFGYVEKVRAPEEIRRAVFQITAAGRAALVSEQNRMALILRVSRGGEMAQYKGQKYVFESGDYLGGGGMADVFAGWRKDEPSVRVAIKVPQRHLTPQSKELFLREAQSASLVAGPNVVRVVDWGRSPDFVAFEFIDGPTLEQELHVWQTEGRRRGDRELLPLFLQLVGALRDINARVIHRDIKPANIFIVDGQLKVADFGISKYVGEITRTRTFKGAGSPPYMAPETFKMESVDIFADQYSLGVVFYEMATGRWPFAGPRFEDFEQQHLYMRPERASSINPDVSERLASIVSRMLAKRTGERFESWDALDRELRAIQDDLPHLSSSPLRNPLVSTAAARLEAVRSRELDEQRQAEEAQQRRSNRERLVDYWADELFGDLKRRCRELDSELGGGVIGFQRINRQAGTERRCWVRFLNAELALMLEPLPIEAPEEFVAWGTVKLTTNKRGAVQNLLLAAEPNPYGSWLEVHMKVSPIMSRWDGTDRAGGRYEQMGQERLVLAHNWQGLFFQRGMRTTMSAVDYNEAPVDFSQMLDELLSILVDDAAEQAPNPRNRSE